MHLGMQNIATLRFCIHTRFVFFLCVRKNLRVRSPANNARPLDCQRAQMCGDMQLCFINCASIASAARCTWRVQTDTASSRHAERFVCCRTRWGPRLEWPAAPGPVRASRCWGRVRTSYSSCSASSAPWVHRVLHLPSCHPSINHSRLCGCEHNGDGAPSEWRRTRACVI